YEAGSASFTLTVVKAKPVLAFSAEKVSKTFGDAPFVSALKTKKTDGAISYSSSDTSVAVVDQDGKVTIKGAGRAKITAKAAAGKCYEAGSASYVVSVAKAANKITAKNIARTTASMTRKVSIKATVKEATTLTYASNNSRLRVSSKGVITIPKNFVGSAVITIRGKASEDYKSVIKRIRIRVRPKPTVLKKLTNPSESKMKVEWKRRGRVTGYQIQYATNSSFSSAKTSRVRDKWTYERTFKKSIKKGRIYYIRIRTYKTVDGKNYYSVWSDPMKLKIKK
ncbi:MAG: Ig-like domain-containing protein, partial [Eubacterium sp.]|nr:Ig-like domain-containing protein [Eubacterium sp.]